MAMIGLFHRNSGGKVSRSYLIILSTSPLLSHLIIPCKPLLYCDQLQSLEKNLLIEDVDL
jgi:hypothetical protein